MLSTRGHQGLSADFSTASSRPSSHSDRHYLRFWGNHDDQSRHPDQGRQDLAEFFPDVEVREALKLRLASEGGEAGLIFLVHGHRETLPESERLAVWFSRLVVFDMSGAVAAQARDILEYAGQGLRPATTPRHSDVLVVAIQPTNPVLIAGHTITGSSGPAGRRNRSGRRLLSSRAC